MVSLVDSIVEQSDDLAGMVEDTAPDAPVPSCPGWTLADLVGHVGATQRWVARLVTAEVADPAVAFAIGWELAPAEPEAWRSWIEESAAAAASAFDAARPDTVVFDPGLTGDGLGFWATRLFGEISVHRIDAALTTGRAYTLSPERAGDAIDDWLTNMTSAGWAANVPGFRDAMRGTGETIRWSAPGIDRSWTVRRTDAPLELHRGRASSVADTDVTVSVEGEAVDLLHLISRRRPLRDSTACTVTGDRTELDHLIDHMVWVGAGG